MAALLSGLFHAPLTAIFLAEITGGYGLIIPLMLVSSISYAIAKDMIIIAWIFIVLLIRVLYLPPIYFG